MSDNSFKAKINNVEIEVSGSEEFVERHISAFWIHVAKASSIVPSSGALPQDNGIAEQGIAKKLSPAEFVRLKKPKSGVDRLLVLGSYLEKHDGFSDFSMKELNAIANAAKLKNVHGQYFTDAVKRGYLAQKGGGKYSLTLSGEDEVGGLGK